LELEHPGSIRERPCSTRVLGSTLVTMGNVGRALSEDGLGSCVPQRMMKVVSILFLQRRKRKRIVERMSEWRASRWASPECA
jgi:hypothetical protein